MSRSRRKTPIFGNTTAHSEKEFKVHTHKKMRRIWKRKLYHGDEEPLDVRVVENIWNGPKDGKHRWWRKHKDKDMRK